MTVFEVLCASAPTIAQLTRVARVVVSDGVQRYEYDHAWYWRQIGQVIHA